MRLVVFDIDGTLTDTMGVDATCFVRALSEVCGFSDIDADWSRYKHATDAGIFNEIFQPRVGRLPTADEIWLRYRASAAHGLAIWMATASGGDAWQSAEISVTLAQRYSMAFVDLETRTALDAIGQP